MLDLLLCCFDFDLAMNQQPSLGYLPILPLKRIWSLPAGEKSPRNEGKVRLKRGKMFPAFI